ncbi:MAG: leishmanolysin-related zinc metalloendopeptidase, partial [Pleurocapsa sp.]
PDYGESDSNGNLLPTSCVSNINTIPEVIEDFNSNIEYFTETMIHEFGHVMGIGTLWEHNNLIDFATDTYSADTYAGSAYGELLGTNEATAIPLATGMGAGSDFSHWSEEVFDNELMSPSAEGVGIPEFASQMTIASLQDMGWNVDYGAAEAYALNSEAIISVGTSTEVDSTCGCGFCSSCGGDALSQSLMDIVAMDSSAGLI